MRIFEIVSQTFYHGSKQKFPIGFVLKPMRQKLEPEEIAVEKILEYFRPANKLPRLKSVYVVNQPNTDVIERAGGSAKYIYEVAVMSVEKNDVHWWAEILNNGAIDFMEGNMEALEWCKPLAEAYWAGKPSDRPLWEYRSPIATIVRSMSSMTENCQQEYCPRRIPTLYHGTTDLHAQEISEHGLVPQIETDSPNRGNANTIPGYTENNIYLTSKLEYAKLYAVHQAKKLGGKPIIYEVKIPDRDKLVPDDRYIAHQAQKRLQDFVKDFDQSKLPAKYEEGDSAYQVFFKDAMTHPWVYSLTFDGNVGYSGVIPPDYIKLINQNQIYESITPVISNTIFFARSKYCPNKWQFDHVGFLTTDGKQIQMSGHKNDEVYITNKVTDDPVFSEQQLTTMKLPKSVNVPTTNIFKDVQNCSGFVGAVLVTNGINITTQILNDMFKHGLH